MEVLAGGMNGGRVGRVVCFREFKLVNGKEGDCCWLMGKGLNVQDRCGMCMRVGSLSLSLLLWIARA